jgi:hypothetical protein
MIHEHENNQDTESFLKSNGKKFQGDCVTAMKLMYSGVRLNGDTCKELYGFHDRRLRNCREARPDIVKSAWKLDGNGHRLYVEFWIDVPKPPTKSELQIWWDAYQNEKPLTIPQQLSLYENQYRDA